MNHQEIFDTVSAHLLKQKAPSRAADGNCRYHNESGMRCAVGCLIADEDYHPDMEGVGIRVVEQSERFQSEKTLRALRSLKAALQKLDIDLADSQTVELLHRLQGAHDNRLVKGAWLWAQSMLRIAENFNLTASEELRAFAE